MLGPTRVGIYVEVDLEIFCTPHNYFLIVELLLTLEFLLIFELFLGLGAFLGLGVLLPSSIHLALELFLQKLIYFLFRVEDFISISCNQPNLTTQAISGETCIFRPHCLGPKLYVQVKQGRSNSKD